MTKSQDDELHILDSFNVTGDAGEIFRVLNARIGEIGRELIVVQQKTDDGWRTLPLRVAWFHFLHKEGSQWPPEACLGAYWKDGRFCVDYESPWYPYDRMWTWFDAHARWRACYDARRERWLLSRIRLVPEDERAMR